MRDLSSHHGNALANSLSVLGKLIQFGILTTTLLFRRRELGDARLATLDDARDCGLLDPKGFYLGSMGAQPLFYSGDAHLLTYGKPGTGKGRDVILPNLAHIKGHSLVVVDIKDGENAYASADHRQHRLGHRIVYLNPWNLNGLPNTSVNPPSRLVKLAERNADLNDPSFEIVRMLIADRGGTENGWVTDGARRLLQAWLMFLAVEAPPFCTLAGLWSLVNQDNDGIKECLLRMTRCSRQDIRGPAASFLSIAENGDRAWDAYTSALCDALRAYSPESPIGMATEHDEFDPAEMKHTPTTVYLITPSENIGAAAQWIALICNHFIERIAAEPGPVRTLFMLDEFAQLPKMACLEKALRLYRGRGIHLWFFLQGRNSLDRVYSNGLTREIEDQVDVLQLWSIDDPSLIKDIGMWSGRTTAQGYSGNLGALLTNTSQQGRDLLQPEDIRAIGDGRQLLKIAGQKSLFVATRLPWFKIEPWRNQLKNVITMATGV